MRLFLTFRILILSLLILPTLCQAQAIAAGDSASAVTSTANGAGPSGIVPTHGFNASLGTSSQHDSSSGWSSVLTPGVAYRFNGHFSLNTSIPLYDYINIEANKGTKADPIYVLKNKRDVFGDASIASNLEIHPALFDYSATVTLGLPTGKPAYGLGAGQPTYDINNHFEKGFGIFSPDIELGIGDSSSLIRPRVRKNYTAVGTISHFQAGTNIDLPLNMSFEADAYEELPLNSATIYSTTGKGKKKVTTATNVGNAEDNGFENSLDIPVSGHLTLSGFYDRSLRDHDDVAGFSLTFLLKAPPRPEDAPR